MDYKIQVTSRTGRNDDRRRAEILQAALNDMIESDKSLQVQIKNAMGEAVLSCLRTHTGVHVSTEHLMLKCNFK